MSDYSHAALIGKRVKCQGKAHRCSEYYEGLLLGVDHLSYMSKDSVKSTHPSILKLDDGTTRALDLDSWTITEVRRKVFHD